MHAAPRPSPCTSHTNLKRPSTHRQVEDRQLLVLGLDELARVDGVYDRAGVAQLEAVASAVGAAGPAGVDEPHCGAGSGRFFFFFFPAGR